MTFRSYVKRQTSGTSSDNEWQRVVQRLTTNDNEWQWMAMSDNEWQRVVKQVTTSSTTSDNEWQRVTTSDKECQQWQAMTTSGTTSDNEWQRVTMSANFSFSFQIRCEPTTKHPKENSLNLEEDLWRRPIELRAETSTREEILTVRSRKCRSSCLQIFTKLSVLKNFAIFTGKHLCWSLFLRKLQVLKPPNLLEGDSNTGVFLWILRNF